MIDLAGKSRTIKTKVTTMMINRDLKAVVMVRNIATSLHMDREDNVKIVRGTLIKTKMMKKMINPGAISETKFTAKEETKKIREIVKTLMIQMIMTILDNSQVFTRGPSIM